MVHFLVLAVCAVAVYLSCEWFVNAVEWLGQRLDVGKMAVGTVLAAVGTALPESVVTLVAVTSGGGGDGKEIGVGAAMGGPLALATVAYGVTGVVLYVTRRKRAEAAAGAAAPRTSAAVGAAAPRTSAAAGTTAPRTSAAIRTAVGAGARGRMSAGTAREALSGPVLESKTAVRRLAKDQAWFLPIFVVKVALGLAAFAFKPVLGLAFFAAYAVYFWREIRSDADGGDAGGDEEELEPLKLQPRSASPATWAVLAQTAAALVVIFFASQVFVRQLDAVGPMLGLSASVTALLLSPIATELPEIMNAVIWVRQGKTELALANISGSMMIQATVPSGLGLLFTPWDFDGPLVWAGVVTMAAIGYLLATLRAGRLTAGRLAGAAGFYGVFGAGLAVLLA